MFFFVILMNPFNIFLFHVLLLNPFGELFILLLKYYSSSNITNMFGNWINGINKKVKARICTGVCALTWTIWNCQNDVIFNKTKVLRKLQVTRQASYWIHLWSYLLLADQLDHLDTGGNNRLYYKMHRCFLHVWFRWLIHVETLSDICDL
jgi:hypothetical protein